MTRNSIFVLFFIISLVLLVFLFAETGIGSSPKAASASNEKLVAQTQTPVGSIQQLEKIKLIISTGIDSFIKELNDNGKLGYRLDNSVNYGGEGETQSFAAVLRLDAGNTYEYDWMSSPDKKLMEGRLNNQAKRGFNLANTYPLTNCSGGSSEEKGNPTSPESLVFRLYKGDAFLLERKNGRPERTKEYQVVIAKVHLGDSAEKTIQAALDAAPHGRPVKILFARQGLLDFSVSLVIESDLSAVNAPKIEYRFLKKTSGLPKDVNALATQGFRFIAGRRVGMIGMVLMAKQANDATTYTFIDEKKHAKEFDKTVALGNSYQGVMTGDLTCGSTEVENERLVFAQNSAGAKHEYKIYNIATTKSGNATTDSVLGFQRLVGENYQVKDLFYSGGLYVIFEK